MTLHALTIRIQTSSVSAPSIRLKGVSHSFPLTCTFLLALLLCVRSLSVVYNHVPVSDAALAAAMAAAAAKGECPW